MERNPDSLQEFYEGREQKEIDLIYEEMKTTFLLLQKEIESIVERIPEDE